MIVDEVFEFNSIVDPVEFVAVVVMFCVIVELTMTGFGETAVVFVILKEESIDGLV